MGGMFDVWLFASILSLGWIGMASLFTPLHYQHLIANENGTLIATESLGNFTTKTQSDLNQSLAGVSNANYSTPDSTSGIMASVIAVSSGLKTFFFDAQHAGDAKILELFNWTPDSIQLLHLAIGGVAFISTLEFVRGMRSS